MLVQYQCLLGEAEPDHQEGSSKRCSSWRAVSVMFVPFRVTIIAPRPSSQLQLRSIHLIHELSELKSVVTNVHGACLLSMCNLQQDGILEQAQQQNALKKSFCNTRSLNKRKISQICALKDRVDLYKARLKGLSSPELVLEEKERRKIDNNILSLFDLSGLDICDSFHGRSWVCWIGNLLQIMNKKVRKP